MAPSVSRVRYIKTLPYTEHLFQYEPIESLPQGVHRVDQAAGALETCPRHISSFVLGGCTSSAIEVQASIVIMGLIAGVFSIQGARAVSQCHGGQPGKANRRNFVGPPSDLSPNSHAKQ